MSRTPSKSSRDLPSDYFASNCYVGGPHDLRQARDAEIPNLMWGADIPHSEGTAPFTHEALRASLWDLPEAELDTLLATTAAKVYGFALDRLQLVAERVGPTVAELKTELPASARPKYPEETCCSVFREVLHV